MILHQGHIVDEKPTSDYIIFMGCSFTWGQGLWSYDKNNPMTPTYDEFIFDEVLPPIESDKYRMKLRYGNLVSENYGLQMLTKATNGGSEVESIRILNEMLIGKKNDQQGYVFPLDLCKLCVFQFSAAERNYDHFEFRNKIYRIDLQANKYPDKDSFVSVDKGLYNNGIYDEEICKPANIDIFFDYLIDRGLDIDEYFDLHCRQWLSKVQKVCTKLEDKGIPCIFWHWEDYYLPHLDGFPWLKKRTLPLMYNGESFGCYNDMAQKYPNLYIRGDKTANRYPKDKDEHPSKEGHSVISESVIKFIDDRKKILLR